MLDNEQLLPVLVLVGLTVQQGTHGLVQPVGVKCVLRQAASRKAGEQGKGSVHAQECQKLCGVPAKPQHLKMRCRLVTADIQQDMKESAVDGRAGQVPGLQKLRESAKGRKFIQPVPDPVGKLLRHVKKNADRGSPWMLRSFCRSRRENASSVMGGFP